MFKTIGIDLDGTIVDTIPVLGEIVREKLGLNFTPGDLKESFKAIRTDNPKVIEEIFIKERFFRSYSLKPYDLALKNLINLTHIFDRIYFITARSRHPVIIQDTFTWLQRYGIKFDDVFFTSSKGKLAKTLRANFIIEDDPIYAQKAAMEEVPALLIDRPWNKELEGNPGNLIRRVKDWDEIYRVLGDKQ